MEETVAPTESNRTLSQEEQAAALLERAYRLFQEGETATALTLARESLRLRDNAPAHSLLAQIYASQGEREQAIRAYECVLDLDPDSLTDRLQRDALRAEAAAPSPVVPHIILAGRSHTTGNLPRALAFAGVGILLALVGSALALQMHGHAPEIARAASALPPAASQGTAVPDHSASAPSRPGKEAAARPAAPSQAQPTQNASVASLYPPAFYPPFYVYPPSAAPAPAPSRHVLRETHAIAPASIRLASARHPSSGNGSGEDRILLSAAGDDKDHITFHIHEANSQGGSKESSASGRSGDEGYRASIRSAPSGADSGADAPSLGEIHSQMAFANSLKLKGDFAGAIKVYTQALNAAGDNADANAGIYEQLGLCFESRGDKMSAITNFQKAIDAFNRMIQAGHKVEEARAGLRACNTGIRACNTDG
ncbi:MAG TPA: hypothetical protein VKT32_00125 [Chthonomonadaceae bacterium]|nr:hypothetical protein [Chthonomonadaceae bacterium]